MEKDIKIDKQLRLIRSLEIAATNIDVALKRAEALLEDHYEEAILRQMAGERAELSEEDLLDKVRTEEILNEIKGLKYENANSNNTRPDNAQDENNAKIERLEHIMQKKRFQELKKKEETKTKKDLTKKHTIKKIGKRTIYAVWTETAQKSTKENKGWI